MAKALTMSVNLKAHVPHLVRAAMSVARQRCEIGYPKGKDCRLHPEQPKREWCHPCALRAAAAKDLTRLRRREADKITGRRS